MKADAIVEQVHQVHEGRILLGTGSRSTELVTLD